MLGTRDPTITLTIRQHEHHAITMKCSFNLYSLLAVLLVAFAGTAATSDSYACSAKAHGASIMNAIGKFCQQNNNVRLPSLPH